MTSGTGTNIISAVKLGKSLFERGAQGDKVLIVISDGEFHQEYIKIEKALLEINLDDIYVFSVFIGTEEGGMIPVYDEGKKIGYKKDSSNRMIISKADIRAKERLADITGGEFYHLTKDRFTAHKIMNHLRLLNRIERRGKMVREYEELFQCFLLPGLFLFLTGYLLPESVMEDDKKNRH